MALLTRIALSALLLSVLAVGAAPAASADCTVFAAGGVEGAACTNHPVESNNCEAFAYADAGSGPAIVYFCSVYDDGTETCFGVLRVMGIGFAALCG